MDENEEKFVSHCNMIISEMVAINHVMKEIERDLLECQERMKEQVKTIDQDTVKEQ